MLPKPSFLLTLITLVSFRTLFPNSQNSPSQIVTLFLIPPILFEHARIYWSFLIILHTIPLGFSNSIGDKQYPCLTPFPHRPSLVFHPRLPLPLLYALCTAPFTILYPSCRYDYRSTFATYQGTR